MIEPFERTIYIGNEAGLTKPCEICGYKYGTKWNFEEIPEEVLEYLRTV